MCHFGQKRKEMGNGVFDFRGEELLNPQSGPILAREWETMVRVVMRVNLAGRPFLKPVYHT